MSPEASFLGAQLEATLDLYGSHDYQDYGVIGIN